MNKKNLPFQRDKPVGDATRETFEQKAAKTGANEKRKPYELGQGGTTTVTDGHRGYGRGRHGTGFRASPESSAAGAL